MSDLPPVHPGEILREQFMAPLGLSDEALATLLTVPTERVVALVAERSPVTADMALRLGRYFATTPEFWLNMQAGFDLKAARTRIGGELAGIAPRGDTQAA